jgi:transposase
MARGIDAAKHERWGRVLREWDASGLSVRDFCDWRKIPESQFWWWRRRLAGEFETVLAEPGPAFMPVTIVEPPASASAAIDIRLTSGHRLRVRAGCDRKLLTDVIALLEGRPC